MITIKITELGNNQIGFYVLNNYNEQITSLSKRIAKDKKQKYIDKLRKRFMRENQSVICNDLTI